ncbi:hypothetical protein CN335_25915 [Bacillus thuringiensis]|nr:hypothetical protein BK762_13660 [Bacillus thuringiensis serovar toumanoffi]PEB59485.1 hypothetical protein COM79_02060 [Bacillus cereus]PEB83404.1 hypothetical protein COM94_29290 [Bacillus thuringiensis]PFF30817.1 hypothetical protein CN335_25915 [Bacillus thuringiensis]PFN32443.1 hypothetical protein COJ56_28230 [Bacillus thuringiensis]
MHFKAKRIYPAICRAVRPPSQNSVEAKKLGGGRADNQWGGTKPSLIKVALYYSIVLLRRSM